MENRNEISDEEILGYMRQGWKFRRKRVKKKYEYIIRRRRTAERGMGPFNEGFWDRILFLEYRFNSEEERDRAPPSLRASLTQRDRRRIARSRDQLISTLRLFRGMQMAEKCVHAVEGFCRFWVWEHEDFFSSYYKDILIPGSEYSRRIVSDEGVDAWIFQADSLYCGGCPAYTQSSN
ncbi:MAG: hypothetical protein JSV27_04455 [Candidatus Bathyarchaeota archaeon]|nr:MAG: hypothetical protein JSV27_04455 [Candidatus Bathyarchaeota archaeon]